MDALETTIRDQAFSSANSDCTVIPRRLPPEGPARGAAIAARQRLGGRVLD